MYFFPHYTFRPVRKSPKSLDTWLSQQWPVIFYFLDLAKSIFCGWQTDRQAAERQTVILGSGGVGVFWGCGS